MTDEEYNRLSAIAEGLNDELNLHVQNYFGVKIDMVEIRGNDADDLIMVRNTYADQAGYVVEDRCGLDFFSRVH